MTNTHRLIAIAATVFCGSVLLGFQSPPASDTPATTTPAAMLPGFKAEVLADQLVAPWAIKFLPDGRALFTERAGRVRMMQDGKLLAEPALVVSDIKTWVKMGLLGLELDPDFSTNHFVYLAECYGGEAERDSWVRVVRYVMSGDTLETPTTLIDRIPAFLNHAGGRLAFGPDKKLYITTGDADRPRDAQDLSLLNGKILRINADGSIPADNPFVGQANANPAIWSYGHRNPQGLAFDEKTGRLFAPEHGPNGGDEVNLIERSANYGWPTVSHDRSADGMVSPLTEFSPSIGPAAATFYHGTMFPELEGSLLVACLRGESILRFTLDESRTKLAGVDRMLFKQFGRIREVAIAPDGAIWITTSEVDPPEGRNTENYDQIIRLSRDDASSAVASDRPLGGVALYAANCMKCHGTGKRGGEAPSLFDRQWLYGGRDAEVRKSIAQGPGGRDGHAFGKRLTEEEIEQLLRFIRIREELYGQR